MTVKQRTINYAEERLVPLILTGNMDEKVLIQDTLEVLEVAL